MNTIRIIKKIESNDLHIDGLDKFKGQNAEIVIVIEDNQKESGKARLKKAHELINAYSGKVRRWSRDELYDR
jgi:hypothetical protein